MNLLHKCIFAWLFVFSLKGEEAFCRENLFLHERLQTIPEKDRSQLSAFFQGMIMHGEFAAVLMGDKPACFQLWVWWLMQDADKNRSRFWFLTYDGFCIWKKYVSLFPELKFSFIHQEYNGNFAIWFAKNEYRNDIAEFCKTEKESKELPHKIMGLLLGYPAKEVDAFCEERRIEFTLQFFPYKTELDISPSLKGDVIDLFDGYPEDLIARLDSLQAIGFLQRVFPPVEPFCPVRFPYFYRCYHPSDEGVINVSWKQEAIDLYNSDEILEKILILMGAQ